MLRRGSLLAAWLVIPLPAQFSGLSSNPDGSSVYFASTLRLKGQPPLLNGKLFVASQEGVQLFRARERSGIPPNSPPCTAAGFTDYVSVEPSQGDVFALTYLADAHSYLPCSYPINPYSTQIVTGSREMELSGILRLSAGGKAAILFRAATGRPFSRVDVAYFNLQTGEESPVDLPQPVLPQAVVIPWRGGRVIANDGTALVAVAGPGQTSGYGYVLKPGKAPEPFPISDGLPLLIDSNASKVLYRKQGLHLLDLRTLQSTRLIDEAGPVFNLDMSDDAGRVFFLRDGQAHLVDTTAAADRVLTVDAGAITGAALSGDGRFVYAATSLGGLFKFNAGDGNRIELIGRTPYLVPYNSPVIPGLAPTFTGSALSDTVIEGAPPFNPYLGNVTMWIGERKVPLIRLEPNSIRFLVPWDIQPENGKIRVLAEVPGDRTPFNFPETEAAVMANLFPQAGAVARQNWQPTYVGPVNTGEIIHVFAIGFGPVSPEVPDGYPAPAAEPLSRITRPFTCSNAEILYAGLAPYYVERVYQIDLRIGPTPGYQKFVCTLGDSVPFTFLTLNVVP